MTPPPTISRRRHPHRDGQDRSAQDVRGRSLIRSLLMILTGVSVALWVLAEIEPGVRARPWIWLFVIVTLTSWPLYAALCSYRRLARRLEVLERTRQAEPYAAGYADGYLDGLAGPESTS